jgi:hypothetical protein
MPDLALISQTWLGYMALKMFSIKLGRSIGESGFFYQRAFPPGNS